ncbi:MAG: hypothetical protein ACREJG_07995 [Candidatus Rokuibacteriota bacterium]
MASAQMLGVQEGRCPVCRNRLIARGENEVIIRNAILRVEHTTGRVTAKCSRCKAWVEMPLQYVE